MDRAVIYFQDSLSDISIPTINYFKSKSYHEYMELAK